MVFRNQPLSAGCAHCLETLSTVRVTFVHLLTHTYTHIFFYICPPVCLLKIKSKNGANSNCSISASNSLSLVEVLWCVYVTCVICLGLSLLTVSLGNPSICCESLGDCWTFGRYTHVPGHMEDSLRALELDISEFWFPILSHPSWMALGNWLNLMKTCTLSSL